MDGKDASPRDAIDEMHRYRDAILYRRGDTILQQPNRRETIGAYVLFPGRSGNRSYEYKEKCEIENIGAIPLLPGEDGEAKLLSFIQTIVTKRSPNEHLGKVIPTRGTTVVIGTADMEYVIVGYCKSPEHWQWIQSNNKYNMRIDDKNGTVLGVPNLLYAKYVLIHSEREPNTNKLFEIKPYSAQLCSRKKLLESGYPSDDSAKNSPNANGHYLIVSLSPVDKNNQLSGKLFDVSKLEGYKSGRQSGKTFVTTINDLEKSIIS